MTRFSVGRANTWLFGILALLVLGVGVGCAVIPAASGASKNEIEAGAAGAIFFAAMGLWMLWEARRLSRLVWSLSERGVEQRAGGDPPIRIAWEEVDHARFRSVASSLRIGTRDGRRVDVTYYAKDFGLLVLQLERALTRHRPASLPFTMDREPTWGARWTVALAFLIGSTAFAPILPSCVRLLIGVVAFLAGSVGSILWLRARNHACIALDAERLVVRQGRSTHVFALAELRGWAVGFRTVQTGAGHPCLWLTTEDDAWQLPVPPQRWLEIAAAFRAAALLHPQLAWLPEPMLDADRGDVAEPVPDAARGPQPRWGRRLAAVAAAAMAAAVAAAATSAAPAPDALGRARTALDARFPYEAIEELDPWLDAHPSDLDAHRELVAAHLELCRDPRACRERDARARYEALRAESDPTLSQLGAWGLARIEGARGDRDRAIEALAAIDPRVVPPAPIHRAALLSAAGRDAEAATALVSALDGPAGSEAAAAYAELLVREGSVRELSALLDRVGIDGVGDAPARALAAHERRVGEWAAIQARRAIQAPFSIAAALLLAGVWMWLARFWGGAHAPSWATSIAGAATGAALHALGAFAADATAMAGPTLGAAVRDVPIAVLSHAVLPFVLAHAWARATPHRSPLSLVSRAGVIAAGVGAASILEWMLARDLPAGLDVAFAWSFFPADVLIAPWAALWLSDLRERRWRSAGALFAALAIASGAYGAARLIAVAWPEVGALMMLVLFIFVASTFKPLLSNAATLARPAGSAGSSRSAFAPFAAISAGVLLLSWIALTRALPWPLALRSFVPPACLALLVVPSVAGFLAHVTELPRWRADWWRIRPGE